MLEAKRAQQREARRLRTEPVEVQIAEAVEEMAAAYPAIEPWNLTPRQLFAWRIFLRRRQRREMKSRLEVLATAFRAEPEALYRELRELAREPVGLL